jgi:hypothetical protein
LVEYNYVCDYTQPISGFVLDAIFMEMTDKKEPIKNVDIRGDFMVLAGSVVRVQDGKDIVDVKINKDIKVRPAKDDVIDGSIE